MRSSPSMTPKKRYTSCDARQPGLSLIISDVSTGSTGPRPTCLSSTGPLMGSRSGSFSIRFTCNYPPCLKAGARLLGKRSALVWHPGQKESGRGVSPAAARASVERGDYGYQTGSSVTSSFWSTSGLPPALSEYCQAAEWAAQPGTLGE